MVWFGVVRSWTVASTVSPSATWISGPGTWPLKAHTLARKPGATSSSTSSMVSSNLRSSARAADGETSANATRMAISTAITKLGDRGLTCILLALPAAQLAQVRDQRVDVLVRQVSAPGGHQDRLVDRLAALLDGQEQLLVGARAHLAAVGVVARLDRHRGGVHALPVSFETVTLRAVDLVERLPTPRVAGGQRGARCQRDEQRDRDRSL